MNTFLMKIDRLINDSNNIIEKCKLIYYSKPEYYKNKYGNELNISAIDESPYYKNWYDNKYEFLQNIDLSKYDTVKVDKLIDLRRKRMCRHEQNINDEYLGTIISIYSNLIGDIVRDFERNILK